MTPLSIYSVRLRYADYVAASDRESSAFSNGDLEIAPRIFEAPGLTHDRTRAAADDSRSPHAQQDAHPLGGFLLVSK